MLFSMLQPSHNQDCVNFHVILFQIANRIGLGMRLGFNKLPVYVYWETNWCESRVASFQASPVFILRVVFSIIQFPTTLVYYPTCKLKNKNEAKSRESKQEEIMCRKCAGHTKVFGKDGLVVFLLQCRKSRVQNHLTLLRQVQQYLDGDNEWLPWWHTAKDGRNTSNPVAHGGWTLIEWFHFQCPVDYVGLWHIWNQLGYMGNDQSHTQAT